MRQYLQPQNSSFLGILQKRNSQDLITILLTKTDRDRQYLMPNLRFSTCVNSFRFYLYLKFDL